MRLLLDCRMSDWSGVGRYTTGLARALAARSGLELVQVCRTGAEPPVPAAEVVRVTAGPFSPFGSLQLGRAARSVRPDVTHCPHFPTPAPTPHPLVVTLHDVTPLLLPAVMPSRLKRAVYRHWNHEAVRYADRLIADSAFAAETIEETFPEARGRFTVIPIAVDDFTSGRVAEAPAALKGAPYVLAMGNVKPNKDLPTLLRAFAAIAEERLPLRLLLAGPDVPGYVEGVLPDVPETIRARIAFTGPLTDDELRGLYAHSAAFAFTSTHEGFGLPPLEAMALGAPVICADAGPLPEVVGGAALSFPAGNDEVLASLVARIVDDRTLADEMRARGHEHVAAFSWSKTAEATVRVYTEALSAS